MERCTPLETRGLGALPEVNIHTPAGTTSLPRQSDRPMTQESGWGVLSIVRTVLIVQDRHVAKAYDYSLGQTQSTVLADRFSFGFVVPLVV